MTQQRVIVGFLVLMLITGGGNLYASYSQVQAAKTAQQQEQASQERAGRAIERKLCTTLGKLSALQPPAGNASANPSRAFEQELHATLDQLAPDLGCGKERP